MEERWTYPYIRNFYLFVDSCWPLQVPSWLHFLLFFSQSSSSPSSYQIHLMNFVIPLASPASETLRCLLPLSCLCDWWTDLSQRGTNQLLPGSDRPPLWLGTHSQAIQLHLFWVLASLATSGSDVAPYFRVWDLACRVATAGARWCNSEAQMQTLTNEN